MKVIHIASFKGNAGDIFNHNGFYSLLNDIFDIIEVTKIEIRDFYFSAKERKRFDREFAETVNEYDLCVLGGGSFFDCQWPESPTGTTMSITDEFIETVTIPVVVNAMGYHEFSSRTDEECTTRFAEFLAKINAKQNWFISIRNDGSGYRLKRRYPEELLKKIHFLADNAFYNKIGNQQCSKVGILGLCITNEAFSVEYNGVDMTTDLFNIQIAECIEKFVVDGWIIRLFAHTPQDVDVLAKIIGNLSEWTRRNAIFLAPSNYISSEEEVTSLYYEWYSKCDAIISMRFHGCVMGFLTGVPTVALVGHEQLMGLYDELEMVHFAVKVEKGFKDRLPSVLEQTTCQYQSVRERNLLIISDIKEEYKSELASFLDDMKV